MRSQQPHTTELATSPTTPTGKAVGPNVSVVVLGNCRHMHVKCPPPVAWEPRCLPSSHSSQVWVGTLSQGKGARLSVSSHTGNVVCRHCQVVLGHGTMLSLAGTFKGGGEFTCNNVVRQAEGRHGVTTGQASPPGTLGSLTTPSHHWAQPTRLGGTGTRWGQAQHSRQAIAGRHTRVGWGQAGGGARGSLGVMGHGWLQGSTGGSPKSQVAHSGKAQQQQGRQNNE